MYTFYTLVCENGLQGLRYYLTREDAQAAADRHNALMGRTAWTVREVLVK